MPYWKALREMFWRTKQRYERPRWEGELYRAYALHNGKKNELFTVFRYKTKNRKAGEHTVFSYFMQ